MQLQVPFSWGALSEFGDICNRCQ